VQYSQWKLVAFALVTGLACGGNTSGSNDGSRPRRYVDAPPVGHGAVIYNDALDAAYRDQSSAVRDFAETSEVHSGSRAISFRPDRRLWLELEAPSGHDLGSYDTLELWVNGGLGGGQKVRLAVFAQNGEVGGGVELADYCDGNEIPARQWERVRVPLAKLGARGDAIYGVFLQGLSADEQGELYVDDVSLIQTGADKPPRAHEPEDTQPENGTVLVDPDADRRPVSPLVYGINTGDAAGQGKMRYPVRRWGGNHTSRYAWDVDTTNRGVDWYFENVPEKNDHPEELPHGSAADRFVDETYERGGEPLVTLPMIGWVAKDRQLRWGFSVQKYGRQQGTDCGSGRCDAGNGRRSSGGFITNNDPTDTSKPIGPEYIVDWKKHMEERTGSAAEGGVRFFALDNELTLWPETHRDIHPGKVTYDEIWEKTQAFGGALKAQDPGAETFGPIAWGWCAYFGSSGECTDGPDRQAHGDFIPWYLTQLCDYRREHDVQLVDYLTVHYYPQSGVYRASSESASVQDKRLRSVKSLYDGGYTDESWINQPIALVPRLKRWVDDYCPGMKTAITEYNFGGEDSWSGAMAQAEAMAIFGREGLDLATRWSMPIAGRRVEDAFALYRNYDGAGSSVAGDTVRARSFDDDAVASYAIRDRKTLYLLLFNKQSGARTINAKIAGGLSGSAKVFGFDAQKRLGARGELVPNGDGLSVSLPGHSATLVVAKLD
jgi:hypothetical protein